MHNKVATIIVIVYLLGISHTMFCMDNSPLIEYIVHKVSNNSEKHSTPVKLEFDPWTNTIDIQDTWVRPNERSVTLKTSLLLAQSIKEKCDALVNPDDAVFVTLTSDKPSEAKLRINMTQANLNMVITQKPRNPEEKYIIKSILFNPTPPSTDVHGKILYSWRAYGTDQSNMTKVLEIRTHPFWIGIADADGKIDYCFGTLLNEYNNKLVKDALKNEVPFELELEPLYDKSLPTKKILINKFTPQPSHPNVPDGKPAQPLIKNNSSFIGNFLMVAMPFAGLVGFIVYLYKQRPDIFANYFAPKSLT